MLIRGHGAACCGASLQEMVFVSIRMKENADLLLRTLPLGEPTYLMPGEIDQARNMLLSEMPQDRAPGIAGWRRRALPGLEDAAATCIRIRQSRCLLPLPLWERSGVRKSCLRPWTPRAVQGPVCPWPRTVLKDPPHPGPLPRRGRKQAWDGNTIGIGRYGLGCAMQMPPNLAGSPSRQPPRTLRPAGPSASPCQRSHPCPHPPDPP